MLDQSQSGAQLKYHQNVTPQHRCGAVWCAGSCGCLSVGRWSVKGFGFDFRPKQMIEHEHPGFFGHQPGRRLPLTNCCHEKSQQQRLFIFRLGFVPFTVFSKDLEDSKSRLKGKGSSRWESTLPLQVLSEWTTFHSGSGWTVALRPVETLRAAADRWNDSGLVHAGPHAAPTHQVLGSFRKPHVNTKSWKHMKIQCKMINIHCMYSFYYG